MAVYKLRSAWWVDFSVAGVRYRKRSPDNTRAGAAAYETVLRGRLARGEPLTPAPNAREQVPTFEEFSEEWYRTYVTVNNKPSEQYTKRLVLDKHLMPSFGKLRLDLITARHIERYKTEKRQQGLSEKSVNNHLAILGKCLSTAVEWGVIEKRPLIRLLKVPAQRYDWLTPIESDRLLGATHDGMWHAMVLVALRTGLRFGEIIALEWPDIDIDRRLLTVRRNMVRGIVGTPKNNRSRVIPLPEEVVDALTPRRRREGLVFHNDGRPPHKDTARKRLLRSCERAGLRPIGWHTLRHTYASQMCMAGAPINVVQAYLGHSTIQMTMRYAHPDMGMGRAAVSRLRNLRQPAVNALETAPIPTDIRCLQDSLH